jgi:hypothetical protein
MRIIHHRDHGEIGSSSLMCCYANRSATKESPRYHCRLYSGVSLFRCLWRLSCIWISELRGICLIGVPLLALPVALLGFRYLRTSATLSLVIMILYFGVQLYLLGPPWSRILHNGTHFHKLLAVTVLLSVAAVLERLKLGLSMHRPERII